MIEKTFIKTTIVIGFLFLNTYSESTQDTIQKTQCQQQILFKDIEICLTNALKNCKTGAEMSDSIAIAFFDSLNVLSDRAYDIYNEEFVLHGGYKTGISEGFQIALEKHKLVSVIFDGIRIFKGSPELVFEQFKTYLTGAGKDFFTIRMQDQLQPCFYDDQLTFMPWDTLIGRVQLWDVFCAKHKGSYAAKQGEKYLKRYLSMFLPQSYLDGDYGIQNVRRSDIDKNLDKSKFGNEKTTDLILAYLNRSKNFGYNFDSIKKYDSIIEEYHLPPAYFKPESTFSIKVIYPVDEPVMEKFVNSAELCRKDWMALIFDTTGQWRLENVNLKFKKCVEVDVVGDEHDGLNCINPPAKGTKYLLNGIPFSSGPVDVVLKGEGPHVIPVDSTITVAVKNRIYHFKSRSNIQNAEYLIFLVYNGNSKYLIIDNKFSDQINSILYWAGDLDRDGKLDLIVNSSLYPGSDVRLLLSGKAKSGELLRWEANCRSWY